MADTLASLLSLKTELEREREKVDISIADLDRVIALLRSRNTGISAGGQERRANPDGLTIKKKERNLEPADDRYEAMATDALAEAGPRGLAPQKLRDDLGLDQPRFKALVTKLVTAGKISRTGERGRGVRYVLAKSPSDANGAALHQGRGT